MDTFEIILGKMNQKSSKTIYLEVFDVKCEL